MRTKQTKLYLLAILIGIVGYYVYKDISTTPTPVQTHIDNAKSLVPNGLNTLPIQDSPDRLDNKNENISNTPKIDERVFIKPDYNRMAVYDNDPNSFTAQEYEEAVEAKVVQLKDKFNAVQKEYLAGRISKLQVEEQVTALTNQFVVEKKTISDKRIDQTHKMRLADVIAANPEYFKNLNSVANSTQPQ